VEKEKKKKKKKKVTVRVPPIPPGRKAGAAVLPGSISRGWIRRIRYEEQIQGWQKTRRRASDDHQQFVGPDACYVQSTQPPRQASRSLANPFVRRA
jgi:hypothetical protein